MEGSEASTLFIWVLPRSFLVLDLLGDVEGDLYIGRGA